MRLKELTRGRRVTDADVRAFITGLDLPDGIAARLTEMTPGSYTGLAAELVGFLDD
jgi:adenylosuccinate lyase